MWVDTSVLYLIFERSLELFRSLSTKTGLIMHRPGETYGDSGDLSHVTFSNSHQWTDYAHNIDLSHLDLKNFHRAWSIMMVKYCHSQLTLRFYILPKKKKLDDKVQGCRNVKKIGGASGKLVGIICSPSVLIGLTDFQKMWHNEINSKRSTTEQLSPQFMQPRLLHKKKWFST